MTPKIELHLRLESTPTKARDVAMTATGVPSLADIWAGRSAPKAFPTTLAEGARTAASFFAASFYGRNDVIYLDHMAIPDIVLVDIDRMKLATMAKIYPTVVETFAEDAFEVAERLRRRRRTFDVVVCDPSEPLGLKVLDEHFDTFSSLVGNVWVTGLGLETLDRAGIEPTMPGIQAWLDATARSGWVVAWLETRNQTTRLAWLGLRRDDARAKAHRSAMGGSRRLRQSGDQPADQIESVAALVGEVLGHRLTGLYLHGSSVLGGRQPGSDIDVIAVAAQTLTMQERHALVDGLLEISGYADGQFPVELIVVTQSEVRPWHYPPTCDFLYGEWMRPRFENGELPRRTVMPHLAVELTLALRHGRALAGPPLADVVDMIPAADVYATDAADLVELLDALDRNTRRVVLTLARKWCRLATGDVRSKDAAAEWALARLPAEHRPVLEHAKELNLRARLADDYWPEELRARLRPYADKVLARIYDLLADLPDR